MVQYDDDDIRDLSERIIQSMEDLIDKVATDVEGNLQRNAPVDHGKLQGSFNRTVLSPFEHLIWSNTEYAIPVSEGYDAFTIEPTSAEKLAFEWPDAPPQVQKMFNKTFPVVFFKSVEHPGFEGTNYIPESIDQTKDRIDEFVESSLRGVGLL